MGIFLFLSLFLYLSAPVILLRTVGMLWNIVQTTQTLCFIGWACVCFFLYIMCFFYIYVTYQWFIQSDITLCSENFFLLLILTLAHLLGNRLTQFVLQEMTGWMLDSFPLSVFRIMSWDPSISRGGHQVLLFFVSLWTHEFLTFLFQSIIDSVWFSDIQIYCPILG
jgi:hypothetical protein